MASRQTHYWQFSPPTDVADFYARIVLLSNDIIAVATILSPRSMYKLYYLVTTFFRYETAIWQFYAICVCVI